MTGSDPTHDDVMRWLPLDMQETLKATTPCESRESHDWWHDRTEIRDAAHVEPVGIYEHWQCRLCGVVVNSDPATDRHPSAAPRSRHRGEK